jgi:hypothetical protein
MPTTNADKRHRVKVALERFPDYSNRRIAEICGVAHDTVNRINPAPQLDESSSSPPVRVGKDGKARRMPTPKPRPAIPAPQSDLDREVNETLVIRDEQRQAASGGVDPGEAPRLVSSEDCGNMRGLSFVSGEAEART